jgi:hypothetical protein
VASPKQGEELKGFRETSQIMVANSIEEAKAARKQGVENKYQAVSPGARRFESAARRRRMRAFTKAVQRRITA